MARSEAVLAGLVRAGARVLLVGPPGIGKTERIKAGVRAAGVPLFVGIDGRPADVLDRLDVAGALAPDVAAGVARVYPLAALKAIRDHRGPAVWFVDEVGRAPLDVQGALCGLMDELRVSNPELMVWAATNRPGDKAGVSALCEPLRSRFDVAYTVALPDVEERTDGPVVLGTWADEVAGWCEWAMDQGAPPEVIAWHRSTAGRTLYLWKAQADPALRMPDYRTWASALKLWGAGIRDVPGLGACLGKPVAAEFLAFARLADQLPTPDAVRLDPQGAAVPVDPSACYLIASMLAASAVPSDGRAFVTYLARLPRVYGALLARDLLRKLGASLTGCAEWVSWWNANQELFN